MSESSSDEQLDTGSLDTEAFRAFAERGNEASRKGMGVPFRLLSLVVSLAALVLIVLFLLR